MADYLMPVLEPAPGERLQRFVGDRILFTLRDGQSNPALEGWQVRLRTNLGRGREICSEILRAHTAHLPLAGASWHDLPMRRTNGGWSLELPLTEPGFFKAKAYLIDAKGWQHWPEGQDVSISVHPDSYRTANTIYCAFTRMFGPNRTAISTENKKLEAQLQQLDAEGYTIIPPSGTFRDLARQLPHIIDTLGCRILHLLPVAPVPTTYAKTPFGRFGSPYACEDLTAVDPALVEFDRRTTGLDQFRELTYATHLKGARVFLDIVINHTGWGSTLQENHPEWFLRTTGGDFASPGAWGNVWEDLAELEPSHLELWDYLAEVFLVWCGRGVDGFRCDAGYKVPLPVWQYIIARVRREFPETIFLLEGLGGSWEVTEQLLTEGGMQWAYSELFQNYSGQEVSRYLEYSFKQAGHTGLWVNYSETHDNERLAKRGRAWSLLRNRLCALTSVSGSYGFTCGVEWLAPERVNVHSNRGLAWGNPENLVPELAKLTRLIGEHPCFFEGSKLTRMSELDAPVYILRRDSEDGQDSVLILVNLDIETAQTISLKAEPLKELGRLKFELTGQMLPAQIYSKDGSFEIKLKPGESVCLAAQAAPSGMTGAKYRRARAQAAWGLQALAQCLPIEQIPAVPWDVLAGLVNVNSAAVLAAAVTGDAEKTGTMLKKLEKESVTKDPKTFPSVIHWNLLDQRRIVLVPPGHALLITDGAPFRAHLEIEGQEDAQHAESVAVEGGNIANFSPQSRPAEARLVLERYSPQDAQAEGKIRFLGPAANLVTSGTKPLEIVPAPNDTSEATAQNPGEKPMVLLTNGIGGMARLAVDFGAIQSKYDCLLAANLHSQVPVDRHVFAKRARVWVNADGFITPLDWRCLISFEPGPPAHWHFLAPAGDGRTVEIHLTAAMLPERNTTVLRFTRPVHSASGKSALPANCDVRLTVRVDLEDRNFHWETKRNSGADFHFSSNTRPLEKQIGFIFTPATNRQLRVFSDTGFYHPAIEWSENIPHPIEQSRGQAPNGDAFSPGWFELPMTAGNSSTLTVCADDTYPAPASLEFLRQSEITATGEPATANPFAPEDAFGQQLLRAARDFVVRRDDGITVIAGYPWFLDWGRDSLICARGLLAAGLTGQVKQLLIVFGRFEQNGTLPNTIHGEDASNRDTTDAPLWYGVVCEETAAQAGQDFYQTKVDPAGRTLLQVLTDIAENYAKGTPNGIKLDAASGLIWSPAHFTWMDTNFPAGTPREGYPVEIQVLWIRLLRQLQRLTQAEETKRWADLAKLAQASLEKYYWMEDRGYLADLLIAKSGISAAQAVPDNALRSNCLFAVSLGLLTGEPARRCIEAARRYLVVPGALRSLAPLPVSPPLAIFGNQGQQLNDPPNPYWGRYEGDEDTRRKPAYHNGTAWTWTFPNFCEAMVLAWDAAPEAVAAARAYLGSADRLMTSGCIGQLPEILDGDAPHTQRGCDAQAWGVTEALRVWKFLQTQPAKK